jgi:hypothetical protein
MMANHAGCSEDQIVRLAWIASTGRRPGAELKV